MIAFISVSDRTGAQELALALTELGYGIYSTGGTQKHLAEGGITAHSISSLTGFPEILGGRVKSIHPMLYGGVLARRDIPEHMEDLRRGGIPPIDLVCVNLYPFAQTVADGASLDDCLEKIDIGGPAIIRAAAKNYPSVLVLVDPSDYNEALEHLRSESVPPEFRRRLAATALQHTARYDTAIAQYLRGGEERFPHRITIALDRTLELRYGENPHQKAALYREEQVGQPPDGVAATERLHGLELSYINILDTNAAWQAASEFEEPTVVIVKHATPCGIASHPEIAVAYQRAYDSDPISPFGGIIAVNRPVSWEMTEAMKGKRYDVIVAPDYADSALERLRKRRDLSILRMPAGEWASTLEYRTVAGGLLVQETDTRRAQALELRVATKRAPTAKELVDLRFAWSCIKHVKSNAIVVSRDQATVGIGGGQPNRIKPVELAIERAGESAKGAILASDAYFPFARNDAVEIACRAGITAIIQPGGGVRDDEAVEVCDEYGVAMVFTDTRAFRH